jgi:formate hydrogenlyase subunit 6/NADH:ubiquinone oxidoreductase subunit I
VDRRFCLFCGACENVCPAEGAIRIVRTGIAHTPIESGAWAAALDKLVSFREVAREYDVKGQHKRRRLILDALLPETQEAAGGS